MALRSLERPKSTDAARLADSITNKLAATVPGERGPFGILSPIDSPGSLSQRSTAENADMKSRDTPAIGE